MAPPIQKFKWTMAHLEEIREHPHLIGHLVGKDKLTEQHSRWIREVWESEDHSSLQAHRGGYKTTAITEIGSIWWLLFHPSDRIALIRKPYTEAAKTLKTIARYMKLEILQSLFLFAHGFRPKAITEKENSLVFNFKRTITKEGSLDAYGVDGSITGNHYDKIICDDIIILKDRLSKAERENTKEFVRELMTNIIDPGKQMIVVGTPWHPKDAWEILPKPFVYDVYSTGILTPEEIQKKRERTTASLFAANYELNHLADSDRIFTEIAEQRPWDPKAGPIFAQLDAAFGGGHFNALTLGAKLPDGRIQMTGWAFQEDVKLRIGWIQDICRRYRVKELHIERNADKGYTGDRLRVPESSGRKAVRVIDYSESMNKHIKIATHLKDWWTRIVWDDREDEEFAEYLSQILDYRERQEPDDAPDSAASLIREAFQPQSARGSSALWDF